MVLAHTAACPCSTICSFSWLRFVHASERVSKMQEVERRSPFRKLSIPGTCPRLEADDNPTRSPSFPVVFAELPVLFVHAISISTRRSMDPRHSFRSHPHTESYEIDLFLVHEAELPFPSGFALFRHRTSHAAVLHVEVQVLLRSCGIPVLRRVVARRHGRGGGGAPRRWRKRRWRTTPIGSHLDRLLCFPLALASRSTTHRIEIYPPPDRDLEKGTLAGVGREGTHPAIRVLCSSLDLHRDLRRKTSRSSSRDIDREDPTKGPTRRAEGNIRCLFLVRCDFRYHRLMVTSVS